MTRIASQQQLTKTTTASPNASIQRYTSGLAQHPWAFLAALLSGWTMLPLALWGALIGGVIGFGVGLIDEANAIQAASDLGISQGIGFTYLLSHTVGGIAFGFIAIYALAFTAAPAGFFQILVWGVIGSVIISAVYWRIEGWTLRVQGCRRLSKREASWVMPIYSQVASEVGVKHPPPLLVEDKHEGGPPNAFCHLRHIVLGAPLVAWARDGESDRAAGIIAHELEHYRRNHVYGLRLVWAAAFPVAMIYNFCDWAAAHSRIGGVFHWFFWPAVVLVRYFISPIQAAEARKHEWQADEAAVRTGHGDGMVEALEILKHYSPSTPGWEGIMLATHPPIELRIEAVLDQMGQTFGSPAAHVEQAAVVTAPAQPAPPPRVSAAAAPQVRQWRVAPTTESIAEPEPVVTEVVEPVVESPPPVVEPEPVIVAPRAPVVAETPAPIVEPAALQDDVVFARPQELPARPSEARWAEEEERLQQIRVDRPAVLHREPSTDDSARVAFQRPDPKPPPSP